MKFTDNNHNHLEIFTEGDNLYQTMLSAIKQAKKSICLEIYWFAADEIGWEFALTLNQAAQKGVTVRVLIDAAGALMFTSSSLQRFFKKSLIEMRLFHHWSWRQPFRYNHRNHRKLLIVDDKVVFVGGFNIHRESSGKAMGPERWYDMHVAIQGPLVAVAQSLFEDFWPGFKLFPKAHFKTAPPNRHLLHKGEHKLWHQHLRTIYNTLWPIANHSIYVTTPYFVPDLGIQRGLMIAAKRGIDVRVLLPRKSNHPLTLWAARAAYANLLHAGVKIYEYRPRMLHAKIVVIDEAWGSIGSANMDYRSFFLNYEINLFSRHDRVCQYLKQLFLDDLAHATEISACEWPNRSWSDRMTEAIGWIARRWL